MDNQTSEEQQSSTKPPKLPEVMNSSHKLVMDNLIHGMSKAKAYQAIDKNCHSNSGAFKQVKTIMSIPENKAYYTAALEHKKYYINQNNQLTLDGTAAILFEVIKLSRLEVNDSESRPGERVNALKLMKDTAIEYAKLIGHGTYDPAIKMQIQAAQDELKQLQDEKKKQLPQEDDALAKLINGTTPKQSDKPQEPIIEAQATTII